MEPTRANTRFQAPPTARVAPWVAHPMPPAPLPPGRRSRRHPRPRPTRRRTGHRRATAGRRPRATPHRRLRLTRRRPPTMPPHLRPLPASRPRRLHPATAPRRPRLPATALLRHPPAMAPRPRLPATAPQLRPRAPADRLHPGNSLVSPRRPSLHPLACGSPRRPLQHPRAPRGKRLPPRHRPPGPPGKRRPRRRRQPRPHGEHHLLAHRHGEGPPGRAGLQLLPPRPGVSPPHRPHRRVTDRRLRPGPPTPTRSAPLPVVSATRPASTPRRRSPWPARFWRRERWSRPSSPASTRATPPCLS